jgi:hypothetical protein
MADNKPKKKVPIKKRPGRETPDVRSPITGKLNFGNGGSSNDLRFYHGDFQSDSLANNLSQFVEIYHLPSDQSVAFKAAITSFTDNYSQQWNATEVFGRMDPIVNYQRTRRNITVGIDVMAANFAEAEVNLGKLSLLEQMQYPVMDALSQDGADSTGHMMGGPLVKIKFLNWISAGSGEGDAKERGIMGYIDGVQFSPKIDLGVFQDGLNIYPKGYEISLNLTVIHEEMLGWKLSNNGKTVPLNPSFPYGTTGVNETKTARTILTADEANVFSDETPPETQEANAEAITEPGGPKFS